MYEPEASSDRALARPTYAPYPARASGTPALNMVVKKQEAKSCARLDPADLMGSVSGADTISIIDKAPLSITPLSVIPKVAPSSRASPLHSHHFALSKNRHVDQAFCTMEAQNAAATGAQCEKREKIGADAVAQICQAIHRRLRRG
ncbi:hypothetical protein FB451DRAFT_1162625 [Mycena latifolia]|nr:hypothetical protein FB451DRAFT_1162625 [Mycena latifolia]